MPSKISGDSGFNACGLQVSDCGEYLLVCPQQDCRDNMVFFAKLEEEIKGKISLTQVVFEFKHDYMVRKETYAYNCLSCYS